MSQDMCHVDKRMTVSQVRVRTGLYVDQISFHMGDGKLKKWGQDVGGTEQMPFDLQPGEFISGLRVKQGDHLDGVAFETSKGRTSMWYGGMGGGAEVRIPADTVAFAAFHLGPNSYTQVPGSAICEIISGHLGDFCPRIRGVITADGSEQVSN